VGLTTAELIEVRFAVSYYQTHNLSVNSSRYKEFSEILRKLDAHGDSQVEKNVN